MDISDLIALKISELMKENNLNGKWDVLGPLKKSENFQNIMFIKTHSLFL